MTSLHNQRPATVGAYLRVEREDADALHPFELKRRVAIPVPTIRWDDPVAPVLMSAFGERHEEASPASRSCPRAPAKHLVDGSKQSLAPDWVVDAVAARFVQSMDRLPGGGIIAKDASQTVELLPHEVLHRERCGSWEGLGDPHVPFRSERE